MKKIILLVGKSGSGKTTLADELQRMYGMTSIQSYTTRPKRSQDEIGHTFVTDEEFDELTDMVGYTDYGGYRYCATAQQVEDNDIYVIDVKGVEFFKNNYHGTKQPVVCYIKCDENILTQRFINRGQTEEDAKIRANIDSVEFAQAEQMADYVFKNNNAVDLYRAANEIFKIWSKT